MGRLGPTVRPVDQPNYAIRSLLVLSSAKSKVGPGECRMLPQKGSSVRSRILVFLDSRSHGKLRISNAKETNYRSHIRDIRRVIF